MAWKRLTGSDSSGPRFTQAEGTETCSAKEAARVDFPWAAWPRIRISFLSAFFFKRFSSRGARQRIGQLAEA